MPTPQPTPPTSPAPLLPGDDQVFSRAYSVVPGSYNAEANTVQVVFSTGARGLRYDWATDQVYEEELEISEQAVDLSRFEAGTVSALDSHRTWGLEAVLGAATRGWVEGGRCLAEIVLTQRASAAEIVGDIKAGIIRAISVGYRVEKWLRLRADERKDGGTRPLMIAKRWVPHEVSFVAVPFDAGCSTRTLGEGQPGTVVNAPAGDLPVLDAPTARHLGLLPPEAPAEGAAPTPLAAPAAQRQRASALARALGGNPPVSMSPEEAAPAAPTTRKEDSMPQPQAQGAAPAAPHTPAAAPASPVSRSAEDITALTELATRHGMADQLAGWITGNTSVQAARSLVLERIEAAANAGQPTQRNHSPRVETVADEGVQLRSAMAEVIAHRANPAHALTDNGRRFAGMRLLEMGRNLLEGSGVRTAGMSPMQLAQAVTHHRSGGMHTTSDFAFLLADVANKEVLRGLGQAETTYRQWARRGANLMDFKPVNLVQLSAMPNLLKVNEHGEIKAGALSDKGLSYRAYTYGRTMALSYQALVNDDLDEFSKVLTGFGESAMRLENGLVYEQLTGNPTMEDGVALFHADHANLSTSSALSFDTLKAGRTAMRLKKGLQGEALNLAPKFLIVPATLETTAFQLTSPAYVPATQAGISEFAAGGRAALTPVVDATLDANSTSAWYLAGPSSADTVEFRFLDGAETPQVATRDGFDVLGTEIRVVHHFATRAVGWRALHKSTA